jgi:ketosteroid isomerase-like protein
MSQQNVELTYLVRDAVNRRDLDAFLALADPDVEWIPRLLEVEGGGSYRGHDGIRSWWESLFAVFPDFTTEIDEVRDLGDVTVARTRFTGQGSGSDVPTEVSAWMVTEWRDGRSVWSRNCRTEAEAIEAAELRE